MFYADYCSYGVRTLVGKGGTRGHAFLAFETKAGRNDWVADHEWDGVTLTAESCTLKEVEAMCGRNFHVANGIVLPAPSKRAYVTSGEYLYDLKDLRAYGEYEGD